MNNIPIMQPNAEERLGNEPAMVLDGRCLILDSGVIRLQEAAYRDGFTAGVQAERQATDRDQINFDEGRRFERAAIVASDAIEQVVREDFLQWSVYIGYTKEVKLAEWLRMRNIELEKFKRRLRALADHLSQTDNDHVSAK